jgi:C-terminal processing protease CtpA/Prc
MKIQTDFLAETVENNYLAFSKRYSEHIWYGKINDRIGYIRMDVFDDAIDYADEAFNEILKIMNETSGIVFDIRKLEGGDDRLARYIAGRFASEKKLYMTSRKRNGPDHGDFDSEIRWFVNPEGSFRYTKPVMLLTGRFTASAGETFTLAMNMNDNVTQIGDTTLGAFSDIMTMELPNGWIQAIPVGDYRNSQGISLEGVGIAPAIFARSTKNETLAGIDRAMDTAITLLTDQI